MKEDRAPVNGLVGCIHTATRAEPGAGLGAPGHRRPPRLPGRAQMPVPYAWPAQCLHQIFSIYEPEQESSRCQHCRAAGPLGTRMPSAACVGPLQQQGRAARRPVALCHPGAVGNPVGTTQPKGSRLVCHRERVVPSGSKPQVHRRNGLGRSRGPFPGQGWCLGKLPSSPGAPEGRTCSSGHKADPAAASRYSCHWGRQAGGCKHTLKAESREGQHVQRT